VAQEAKIGRNGINQSTQRKEAATPEQRNGIEKKVEQLEGALFKVLVKNFEKL
jgi:hypothetical protein